MATLGANAITLLDWAKRRKPTGGIETDIAEILHQTNEVIMDMRWKEGNLPTGHQVVVRTGLPAAAWRMLNQGSLPTKSTTAQVVETTGILDAWSEVDTKVADLEADKEAFLFSEAVAHIEGMNQEFAQTLFYGDPTADPKVFLGLAPRYSTGIAAEAQNAQNVIDGGGTGSDNTSIWLIGWGDQSAYGIYPKGSLAGLKRDNKGRQTKENAGGVPGALLDVYREHFEWTPGLCLKDWRYVVRIANIDVSNLVSESNAANLIKLMIRAIHRIPNLNLCRPVFYCNRTVKEMLDIQAQDKSNVHLLAGEEEGRPKLTLRGIPIRTCDALLETEDAVPFA